MRSKSLRHQSFRGSMTACLLAGVLMGHPYLSEANAAGPSDGASSQKAVVQTTVAANSPEAEALERTIRALQWLTPPESQFLSLSQALDEAKANNLDIKVSQERLNETRARQASVESRRVLFFFKFINANYLEGSALSDVLAEQAHVEAVTEEVLRQTADAYFAYSRAVVAEFAAFESLRQSLNQLDLTQSRFQQGEGTSIDVFDTRAEVFKRYQSLLEARGQRDSLALMLAENIRPGGTSKPEFWPTGLSVEAGVLAQPDLATQVNARLPEGYGALLELARVNRADVQELLYRLTSMENLIKASAYEFDKTQIKILEASRQQLVLRKQKVDRQTETMLHKTLNQLALAAQKIDIARAQRQQADEALWQVKLSFNKGFSSNRDVLQAQIVQSQAAAALANAQLERQALEVQLLADTGQLFQKAQLEPAPEDQAYRVKKRRLRLYHPN